MAAKVGVGSVVRVPLHGRRVRAYVTELLDEAAVPEPSSISSLVGEVPLFDPASVELARWAAHRYLGTLGSVLHQAVPGRYSAPPASARVVEREPAREPGWVDRPGALDAALATRRSVVVCPPGRELDAVRSAVAAFGTTLVVVPRTATADGFAAALPGACTVHAEMRPSARAAAWARARDGAAGVVVAGRGGVFVPVAGICGVVVAGAHDPALKGERHPRVHALWTALRRAELAGVPFVAVSAAPPLELAGPGASRSRWVYARRGASGVRPEISSPHAIAKRGPRERRRPAPPGPLTHRLVETVRHALALGADALVFAARRGSALRVRCADCGWYPRCPSCGTGLAVLSGDLRCRACGRAQRSPSACPDCGGTRLDHVGWGSERIASELRRMITDAPVVRADRDAPLEPDRPTPAVIVGTRAAVEALPAASLGAVVVSDLDQLLGLPDFRAAERAFATLQDLAALLRRDGRFLVQTREREHHVVQAFARGSWRYFATRELPLRRAAGYPPFAELVRVELDPADADALRAAVAPSTVVGPVVRPDGVGVALIRAADVDELLDPLARFVRDHPSARADVDPVELL